MKKRIISITILFITLMTFVVNVKADAKYTAASVNENLEKYRNAINEMTTLKCNNELYNQTTVDKCNSLSLKKTDALSYLYNARQYDKKLITDEIEKVLEENSSECNTIFSTELQDITKKAFLLFYIAGPILLILFGTLDMTNAIIAGDEKRRKALFTKFVKRSIALILLFATPAIVNLLVNVFGADKYTENTYTCTYEENKLTLKYTKVIVKKKGGSSSGNTGYDADAAQKILDAAAEINKVSSEGKWSYDCVFASNVLKNYRNKAKNAHMCCADYVSAVLALAGIFTEDEINHMQDFNKENCGWGGYNTQASGVHAFLLKKGWTRISDPKDLQPGDILMTRPMSDYTPPCIKEAGVQRAGHVEIYAGDGMKFNAGNTKHISTMGPHKYSVQTTGTYRFIEAYRYPGNGGN